VVTRKCDEDDEQNEVQTVDEYADYALRLIFLHGVIDGKLARGVCRALYRMVAMDNKSAITFLINSPGGSVMDGLAIIDIMRMLSCAITTIIVGEACSMAAVISVCGDVRYIAPHGFYMTHPMTGGVVGDIETCNNRTGFMTELDGLVNKILLKQTRIPRNILKNKAKLGELWLNAEKALEYRVVDEIVKAPLYGIPNLELIKKAKDAAIKKAREENKTK